MTKTVARLVEECRQVQRKIERFAARCDADAWGRRPPAGGWSAGDCIAHLNLTSERFLPVIDDAVGQARAAGLVGDDPGRLDLWGRLLLWWLEPPYRTGSKTAPAFVPVPAPKDQVMARFVSLQDTLCDSIASAGGLLISKVRIKSPFDARLRYSLYSTFRILPCHQRRHLWQAERAVGPGGQSST